MSLVTPLCVFFAVNPDEELTSEDIGAKWDVDPNNIGKTLRYAEQKGWVKATKKPNPSKLTKQILFYTAGPRLLKEIGRCPPLEFPTDATSKDATPKPPNAALNSALRMTTATA